MRSCTTCQTSLLDHARFCHKCGAKQPLNSIPCPECGTHNPSEAQFCANCGLHFKPVKTAPVHYQAQYPLDFSQPLGLGKEIMGHLINALEFRVASEHHANQFGDFLDLFYQSEFNKIAQLRAAQLAEEVYTIHTRQNETVLQEIDEFLHLQFKGLLDHFIILHGRELVPFKMPKAILKYENLRQGEFDLAKMILDFLDLETEKEPVYTDFVTMPLSKLKNATQSFLFPAKDEKILLICDQTVFGSCREGFALTEAAIYWKAHFENARKVSYPELKSIEKEQDWLTINEYFFNVNPGLNWKMMKLLQKLMEVY